MKKHVNYTLLTKLLLIGEFYVDTTALTIFILYLMRSIWNSHNNKRKCQRRMSKSIFLVKIIFKHHSLV